MNNKPSLRAVANQLGKLLDEPKLPRLDPVDGYVYPMSMKFTPQELEWLREDAAKEQS